MLARAPIHHKKLYFEDGSAIFQVENTLYKLHMSLLQPNSIVLNNMFTMPEGNGPHNAKEGLSDDNPIQLSEPFTVKKFDNLLSWFYSPQFPPLDALKDIPELATFLEMEIARTFAIQALASPTMNLSPATRLSLAISFRIGDWVEPAFHKLIATPANMMSLEDFTQLGPPVMYLIMATQAAIHSHHLVVAYNPLKPPSHYISCKKLIIGCQCNWEAAWWDGLARHYLHPDFLASPQDIISKLESAPIIGVTTACRLQAVEIIKQQRVFEAEDDMRQAALVRLKEYKGTVFGL
ncbi:hypothetical protein K439DRAFT_1612166 [Ramaria rubella]|nr:hypothetical protein K439DRAFT_1612166 [Ramaria rubella]